MAQVPVQAGAGGALGRDKTGMLKNKGHENIAVGASATVQSAALSIEAEIESLTYMLSTDATVGLLTIQVQHDPGSGMVDTLDGTLVLDDQTTNSVLFGDSVQVDLADVGSDIVIGVSPSAQERNADGTLLRQLQNSVRLELTTDGTWNGTEVDLMAVGGHKRHMPGAASA